MIVVRWARFALLVAAASLNGAPVSAQPAAPSAAPPAPPIATRTLDERIAESSYPVAVRSGQLVGDGAGVLREAVTPATFVMLGEDHGTTEIPIFASALFAELAPRGFHTLAVETGATVAPLLQDWSARSAGADQLTAFQRRYPGTLAFYGWRGEFAFLQSAQTAASHHLDIWGLDQELMGSGGFLLERIISRSRSARTRALAGALLAEQVRDERAAFASGDPRSAFMIQVSRDRLIALGSALMLDRDGASLRDLDALLASKAIYGDAAFAGYHSRATLMKQSLGRYLRARPAGTKVFFKFGLEHTYRGFNPQRINDLGNDIGELADASGRSSVNVMMLAVDGEQLHFTGYGRPFAATPITSQNGADPTRSFLMPFAAHLRSEDWTLFDLRALRRGFTRIRPADPEVERAVFGYDFLVLVPHATAQTSLDATAF